MYSQKTIPDRPSSPRRRLASSRDAGCDSLSDPRSADDDWAEEANRQAAALTSCGAASETGIFAEFRRKLAMGEALSRAVAKLAEALRFSGRITVSFHQGRITKTVFEELHIRGTKATQMSP